MIGAVSVVSGWTKGGLDLILHWGEVAFGDDREGWRGWDGDRGAVQENVIGWNGRLLGKSESRRRVIAKGSRSWKWDWADHSVISMLTK